MNRIIELTEENAEEVFKSLGGTSSPNVPDEDFQEILDFIPRKSLPVTRHFLTFLYLAPFHEKLRRAQAAIYQGKDTPRDWLLGAEACEGLCFKKKAEMFRNVARDMTGTKRRFRLVYEGPQEVERIEEII